MRVFDLVKEMNNKRVIKTIREKGPISRIDISELTGIPQPTITRITEELIKEGLIRESGSVPSSRGRRPILLTFNPSCYYSVGVQMGRSTVRIALTDLDGNIILEEANRSLTQASIGEVTGYAKGAIGRLLQQSGIDPERLLGVGVGIPGPLNRTDDDLVSPPNFYNAHNIPLRSMLSQGDEYPVIIGTNSGAAAISEKWFGKGIGYDNFIYVTADTGIGSAMIINGNLFKGAFGEAGGIGHFTIDIGGKRCSCGKYGCLETWVSIPQIEEETRRRLKLHYMDELPLFEKGAEEIGFDDIVRALHQGSALCRQIMVESGRYLGIGVANLIDLINPELVIIGGRLGTCSEALIDSLRSTVETRVLNTRGRKTPVITSELDNAVVRGAAALVIDNTFSFFSKI